MLNLIRSRRSIRAFTGEAVTKEQLRDILSAAMAAPSARNRKPWEFLVVTDPDKITAICNAHPYAAFGEKAGAVIIPFGNPEGNDYLHQDLAAATENMLLEISALGLGCTWCGMNEERQAAVRAVTGIPEHLWQFAVLPIGVPAETKEAHNTFYEEKVHWEEF
jgi:nitroreductase